VSPANLTLRFVLELSALAALSYGGAHARAALAARVALAIVAPLAAAIAWGAVVSPKARVRASAPARLLVELAVFGAGVSALLAAGRVRWATAFAVAIVLHELWRAVEQRRASSGVPRR
jgi:hypothetical protein